jgi:D-arabinose 1-dehydrogenase-like Zn-dependent alcohol dehydrogenase
MLISPIRRWRTAGRSSNWWRAQFIPLYGQWRLDITMPLPKEWPVIPGVDAVVRSSDGTLAYSGYPQAPFGTLAEWISVPESLWIPLPSGADPVAIAAGINPGMASWLPLQARLSETGALGPVLILGVTGMAGFLAVQNALALGSTRVIGIGRNPQALASSAQIGAETVRLTGDQVVDVEVIRQVLGTEAPQVVLDFLWGPAAEAAFAALERHGLDEDQSDIAYIQIGSSAAQTASLPAALLRSRKLRLWGSGAGSGSMAYALQQVPRYIQMIADKRVEIPVETFPLSEINKAWELAAHGRPRIAITSK